MPGQQRNSLIIKNDVQFYEKLQYIFFLHSKMFLFIEKELFKKVLLYKYWLNKIFFCTYIALQTDGSVVTRQ